MKERLDVLLVQKGYAPSREKAKAIIMSGNVFIDGQREDKAGTVFDVDKAQIEIKGTGQKYVSRGGLKLEKAVAAFGIILEPTKYGCGFRMWKKICSEKKKSLTLH